jgi:homoserine dehydrogenase
VDLPPTTPGPRLVWKLGSSCLRTQKDADQASATLAALRTEGAEIVLVASARAGETDRLDAEARALGHDPSSPDYVRHVLRGEEAAVAELARHLDRAGLPHERLDLATLGLRALGLRTDAEPIGLEPSGIRDALASGCIVLVPGFVALDPDGAPLLLGRGGSDLSAVFIAAALGATCRLVKDVPGWFTADPADPGPMRPGRFRRLAFADALARKDRVVQPKAVRFAAALGQPFEVGRVDQEDPTLVGPGPTEIDAPLA